MPSVSGYTVLSGTGVTPVVIRLTGSGFYGTSPLDGVTIGGFACAATYNDPNTLTVIVADEVPAGSSPVVVTVSGIASTDAVAYTPPV